MSAPALTDCPPGPGCCLRGRSPPVLRSAVGVACVTDPLIVIFGVPRLPPPHQVSSDICPPDFSFPDVFRRLTAELVCVNRDGVI